MVQFAIGYFLESADISVSGVDLALSEGTPEKTSNQGILTLLPASMQRGIEQYAAECEFPQEYVVELAVTFLLDPDASGFEDCEVGVRREQVSLLKQYRQDHRVQAA